MGEDVAPRIPDIEVHVWFEAYDSNDVYIQESDLSSFFKEVALFERLVPHVELKLRRVSQRLDTYPVVRNEMRRTDGQLQVSRLEISDG